jgi:hypothetical protein
MTKKDKIIAMYEAGISIDTIVSTIGSQRRYITSIIQRTNKYIKAYGYSKGLQRRAIRL